MSSAICEKCGERYIDKALAPDFSEVRGIVADLIVADLSEVGR